jgi:membrane associated rhomboid family serine protease
MFELPPVTQGIIIANTLVFLLELVLGNSGLISAFALWPVGPQFFPWQILTYAFLHGSVTHLLFNMFAVYMFGADMERVWGGKRYLTYYLACAVSAALTQLLVSSATGAYYPTLGASGAVFGLLLAFAHSFPHRRIMLLIPPVALPARLFVVLYGALELVLGVTGTQAGVAHFAHLGGLAGGFLLLRYWKKWR